MTARCVTLLWETDTDQYSVVPMKWLKHVVHIYNPTCGVGAPDTFYVTKYLWSSFAPIKESYRGSCEHWGVLGAVTHSSMPIQVGISGRLHSSNE